MFNLKPNTVLTSPQLANLFETKTLKSSRFIKPQNSLILITDYTQNHHPDKWVGDILHYTGGTKLTGSITPILADSRTNGVSVHLFQVFNPGKYTYTGSVQLAGDPYTEYQTTIKGEQQLVWVFPLKPTNNNQIPKPNGLVFDTLEDFKNRGEQAYYDFLRRRANYVGYRIQHKEHGFGTIHAFDGTILTVLFDNHELKTYNFDKSTKSGYIKFAA